MAFGAVDIQTKRMREEGFYTALQSGCGSHNTWAEVIEHGGKAGEFDYYLIQSYRSSDGHRENADGELQNYFGRVGYDVNDNWNLNMTVTHTNNGRRPRSGRRFHPSDGTFSTEDYFTVATLSNSYEGGKGYIKLYLESGGIDWVNQDGTPGLDRLTDYENRGIRARETVNLWRGGEVMVGLDLDYLSGEVEDRSPVTSTAYFPEETWRMAAPYAAVSHLIGSEKGFHAIPSAGLRYIDHSEYGSECAPQAA
jgi:iron complex outermembrane receptor protein